MHGTTIYTEKDLATLIHAKVGSFLHFRLPVDPPPAAGFGWVLAQSSKSMFKYDPNRSVFEKPDKPGLGAMQYQLLQIEVLTPGTNRLDLELRRVTDRSSAANESFYVIVNAED